MRIILNLQSMKKDIKEPRKLFNHVFGLSKDYIITADIMRHKYGIGVRIEPDAKND